MRAEPKYKKYSHVKIGRSFVNLLLTHPVFQAEPKAINTAHYWLNRLETRYVIGGHDPVQWDWEDLANRFKPFAQSYTQFKSALWLLGLVEISNYIPPKKDVNGRVISQGKCKSFRPTEKCSALLLDSNREYLHKLIYDRHIIRDNKRNIAKREARRQPYKDEVLEYISDLLRNLEVNAVVETVLETLRADTHTQCSTIAALNAIQTKSFGELKRHEHIGRVYNEFVALQKEYRKYLTYKGMKYSAVIDMRACHPTFLALLLSDTFKALVYAKEFPNRATEQWHRAFIAHINPFELQTEVEQWTEIFCAPMDPRIELASYLGIQDIKTTLNSWLNGKGNCKLTQWFKDNYPCMHEVWQCLERSKGKKDATGITIMEAYESELFLDPEVYRFAESIGVKLSYEYDGVGVFSNDSRPVLTEKLSRLQLFIQRLAENKFGMAPILTTTLYD